MDTGGLSPGVKRPGREANHPSPSSDEIKISWSYTYTVPYNFMAPYLVKHNDKSNLPLAARDLEASGSGPFL